MRCVACRLVGHKQFHHHLARSLGTMAVAVDDHTLGRGADTGGGKNTFALNFDHAGAAIAIGAIVAGIFVAQMRDIGAVSGGGLPDGFVTGGFDLFAIKGKCDGLGYGIRHRHCPPHPQENVSWR